MLLCPKTALPGPHCTSPLLLVEMVSIYLYPPTHTHTHTHTHTVSSLQESPILQSKTPFRPVLTTPISTPTFLTHDSVAPPPLIQTTPLPIQVTPTSNLNSNISPSNDIFSALSNNAWIADIAPPTPCPDYDLTFDPSTDDDEEEETFHTSSEAS